MGAYVYASNQSHDIHLNRTANRTFQFTQGIKAYWGVLMFIKQ